MKILEERSTREERKYLSRGERNPTQVLGKQLGCLEVILVESRTREFGERITFNHSDMWRKTLLGPLVGATGRVCLGRMDRAKEKKKIHHFV